MSSGNEVGELVRVFVDDGCPAAAVASGRQAAALKLVPAHDHGRVARPGGDHMGRGPMGGHYPALERCRPGVELVMTPPGDGVTTAGAAVDHPNAGCPAPISSCLRDALSVGHRGAELSVGRSGAQAS